MRLNSNLILRQVGGEYMIVNPFSETMDMAQVYSLNETAAWLWKQLENKEFTVDEAGALLCNEYEVNKDTARNDANELCRQWLETGLAIELDKKMISAPLQKAFMLLLRQGLWDRQEDCSALFPLDEKEWNEIHSMARKQTVQGIIYDGIRLLPTEAVPPRKVLLGWMVEVAPLERVHRQHREPITALQQIYVQSPSIPFLLLKGIGTADFYPHPEHRIAGDIDLWFGNKTQTEQANQRMEKLGLPVKRGTNGEASCLINRVLIEHHSRLIELHNPFLQKEIRQWEAGVFTNSQGKLPSEANHLLLSTHILKHLINEGIGLRQLCDIAMAFNALHSVTNKNELECICRKWHIHRWNRLLYALLIKYLGVPADLLPFSTSLCPDKLMQEIWESGNFGHGDERYGERPTGKWANKRYTLKRIFHKMHLSLGYAFDETFWWLAGLALLRFKEMIKKK